MSNQTTTPGFERPELKKKQSKWSWPHLVPVQGKTSGSPSSDRPFPSRTPSDESQKSRRLDEHKTPSQTFLPVSPGSSEKGSAKSTKISAALDSKAELSGDSYRPSSPSSSSSWSTSSGHGTIRVDEPQAQHISERVEVPRLEKNMSTEAQSGSETDFQNGSKLQLEGGSGKGEVLNPEREVQKSPNFNSGGNIATETALDSKQERRRSQAFDLGAKNSSEVDSDRAGVMQTGHDSHLEAKQPDEEMLASQGDMQEILDPYGKGKLPRDRELDFEKEQEGHNLSIDGRSPKERRLGLETEENLGLHQEGSRSKEQAPGLEEDTQMGYDLYLEVRLQEAKEPRSRQSNPANESNQEGKPQNIEKPQTEESLRTTGKLDLEEDLQQASTSKPASNDRAFQPNAPDVSPEPKKLATGSSASENPATRHVHFSEDENAPPASENQSEPKVVKAVVELPQPVATPTKGRKVQIPKIFIENASEDTNIPKSTPRASVSKEPFQAKAGDNNVPNSTSKASDISSPTPKVSVFKEISQEEPWSRGPPTPYVYSPEEESQEKSWSLGTSALKHPVGSSSNTISPTKPPVDMEGRASLKESVSDDAQGKSELKKRKLYLRKARNAAARRFILKATLGRQLAGQTKPALRRLADGETITINLEVKAWNDKQA